MRTCRYRTDKGFTTGEIIISIMIIILFTSLIVSAYYNYYISIQSKNRKTIATNIIIDIIENVEIMEYDDVTQDRINALLEDLKNDGIINKTAYTVTVTIQKYNEIEGNEDKQDLIKVLNVKVEYLINNISQTSEVTRLIIKNDV